MRQIMMTPGQENQIVWLIRINMDDGTYVYFADSAITLSGIVFSGSIISYGSMSEFGSDTDVLLGGGIGSMDHFSFALSRYTVYNDGVNTLQSFFNDWYPATGKPVLTSKEIDLGLTWNTATNINQVTWLENYRVSDYKYNTGNAIINCIEPDELSGVQIPRYKVQDKFDDGISYYLEAPENSYGAILPIVYGDFTTLVVESENFNLLPGIIVDKNNKYKYSSHICKQIDSKAGFFFKEIKNMLLITTTGESHTNNRAGYIIDYALNMGKPYFGNLVFHPAGYTGGGTNPNNCLDTNLANFTLLIENEMFTFRANSRLNNDKIGHNSLALADANIIVDWQSPGGAGAIVIACSLNGVDVVSTADSAGGDTTIRTKRLQFGTQEINNLDRLDFRITNVYEETIRLINILVEFPNQIIYSGNMFVYKTGTWLKRPLRLITSARPVTDVYESYKITSHMTFIPGNKDVYDSELFAAFKGYVYDNWID